jgi:FtsP/CotA-like multicopper oxidase with cupredoxin domain
MHSSHLSRRRFLALTGSLGAYLASGGERGLAMMCGGGMSGAAVIDPPPGDILKNPAELQNMSNKAGLVEVSIESKIAQVNVNGTTANLYTYNGLFPGPTLRVKRGDKLKINFKNSLPYTNTVNVLGHERDVTNLHTHGLHVSPSGNADNMMLQFNPGQSFTHEYDLSYQYPGSMCFYHPHIHGSVSEQYGGGQAGVILVEDGTKVLDGYTTQVLVLKDLSLVDGWPAPYGLMDFMHGKEGPLVMANGQVNPRVAIRPGEVQRWRIVNACTARFFNLSLQNHQIHLIGTESGLLDKPYALNRILLSPGERIDLLVKGGNPGSHKFLSLPYNRGGCDCCGGMGSQTVTLMTMVVEGDAMKADIPPSINPDAKRLAADAGSLARIQMSLSMNMRAGFINGKTFGSDPYTISSKTGTYEIWEIINQSMMDHPFHHHVNAAQVLSITGGDADYAALYSSIPGMKDTTIVPKFGSATLLMPVMDWTGMSMMHCHIIEHEDIGMMGVWNIA